MTQETDLIFKGGLAERLLRGIWGSLRCLGVIALVLAALVAACVVGAYYVAAMPHELPSGVLVDMAQMEEAR